MWARYETVEYTSYPVRLTWSASDPCLKGYMVDSVYNTGPYAPDRMADELDVPVYDTTLSDYDDSFGSGGGYVYGYAVGAYDCFGNSTTIRSAWDGALVAQENGKSVATGANLALTYSGTWTVGFCDCASGGQQRATRQAGAAVSFTRNYAAGDHVALVMAKGPARGKAGVYVDGSLVKTVNTYATEGNTNRIVVFDQKLTAGTHTIRLVNQGTVGHPRIDLDAVLVS